MPRRRALQLRHPQPRRPQQRTRAQLPRPRQGRVKRATWGEFWVALSEGWFCSSFFCCVYGGTGAARTILERLRNSNQTSILTPHLVSLPCFYPSLRNLHLRIAATSADYISPFDTNSANIDPFPLGYRAIGSIDNSSRLSSSSWAPAMQQKSSLHHATNSMSTSSHGNFSLDPSGFAESLAGSSSIGRPTSAGASSKSRHLLRQPSEVTVSTFLPPVQHVDSGMRSIDMEMLTGPPELPPVYSPV